MMEVSQEEVDLVKERVRRVIEEDEEADPALVVLSLVELATEIAVDATGGAAEGLCLVLAAVSGAPIVAEETESDGYYVN